MPYLKDINKKRLEHITSQLNMTTLMNCGELNYLFTMIIKRYLENQGLNYTIGNDVVGALDCCKQEFYDRILRPYENKKIVSNGDVY